MTPRFEFDWPVDRDGYEWAEDAGAGWVIRRRGGPNRFYRPLEDNPGLFRRFASLSVPLNREELLNFTNDFGFIDGTEDNQFFIFDRIQEAITRFKCVVSAIDEQPPFQAAVAFNSLMHPHFRTWLDIRDSPPGRPVLQIVPTTLYGAMMVQMAEEISGIVKYRKCKQCPEWFALGKSRATTRREFCSDRCRVAWHREHREGGPT